jgi:ATP-binding cassette, subfamily B, multidrug efflux pump
MRRTGLRFLMLYMGVYRWTLVVCTIYALIGAGASAFSPTLLGWAIDELLAGVRPQALMLYALGLVGLACTLALFRYLLRMLTGSIASGVSYQMSQDLFQKLLLFDQATIQQYGTGDLLSRASSDFIYIWRFYSAGFQMSMHAILLLLIGSALMALTSPILAGIVVLMLVLSVAAQMRLGRVLESSFDKVQQEMANLSSFAQEHLNAARMLAAYAQEPQVVAAFKQANEGYVRRNLSFVLGSSAISPLPSLMVRLAATLVLAVGGTMIINGQLTLGEYVQFIVYLALLSTAAQQLSQAFERLQQGSAAAGRIGVVVRRRPQILDAPDAISLAPRGALSFEGVGVRAAGGWALRDIDLEVPAGTTLGIVGATGSGKSTLLSLLGRVRDPDEGCVRVDGHDVSTLKLASLRRAMVYVPQETLLFSMPLRDNITLGLRNVADDHVNAAAQAARLTNDLAQLPQGLATPVGERGATLSGGQKQRVAIARALVRDPSILLLDDSLSSLDTQTAAEVLAELRAARERRTCLIVSQRLASVRDADQIVVLDAGRIVERGTHGQLLALDGRYAAMYRRELQQAEEVEGRPGEGREDGTD